MLLNIIKLPHDEVLNLNLIRRVQFELDPPLTVITWSNGETAVYYDSNAIAIINHLKRVTA